MHYDDNLPLFLITDASLYAYGCVLAHKTKGIFHPVMFHGKCFSQSEYRYSIFEKELKALYNAVRSLSAFLKGKQFTVMVDNKGVAFLKTLSLKDHLSHRWGKWLSYLSEFDFHIEAIKSNTNPADPISRMICGSEHCAVCKSQPVFLSVPFKFMGSERITPVPTEQVACQTPKWFARSNNHTQSTTKQMGLLSKTQIAVITHTTSQKDNRFSNASELSRLQDEDPDLKHIKERIAKDQPPPSKPDIQTFSLESRKLLTLWDNLSLKNGVLYLTIQSQMRTVSLPVIPKAKFIALCEYVHEELVHPGYDKLYNYLHQNFIVFGIASIAKYFTRSCEQCQKTKPYTFAVTPEMTSLQAAFQGACVSCDHFGPLPPSSGYTYILAITDVFSRYLILVPQKHIDANETATTIVQHYVEFFGLLLRVHSDNGKCFISSVWQNLWDQLGVAVTKSTPYHPKGNSLIEVFNKSIKHALVICTNTYPRTWSHFLPAIMMAHNATVNSATTYTPNFLQLGREVTLPTNFLVEDSQNEINDIDSFIANYVIRLHMAMTQARQRSDAKQKITKIYYDRNAKVVNAFSPGQLVLLKDMHTGKLDQRFPDLCTVIRKLHNNQYLIQRHKDNYRRKANVAQLKPFLSRTNST